jgi:hypothetical protein
MAVRDQPGQLAGKGDEVRVLRHEVGFAIQLDDRPQLRIGCDMQPDDALGRYAGCGLGGLVAELDAQYLLGLRQLAARFGERLLAFHHGRVGLVAQLLHHACGNFGHCRAPEYRARRAMRRGAKDLETCDRFAAIRGGGAVRNEKGLTPRPAGAYSVRSSDSSTSTNSSVPPWFSISCTDWVRPSRMASATPLAYSLIARLESSFPGMT